MDYSERKLALERIEPASAGAEASHLAAFENLSQ